MNRLEKKMLDALIDLKENHHVVGVKAEFEAEGTRMEEALRLKEVVTKAGLELTIKIGGCEAIKDLFDARIIGVNNRNLKDFTVDVHNSERLRKLVPENILFVAESGIKTADDIQVLRDANVNAVLIGETLMRASDKKAMLDGLKGINVAK